VVIFPKTEINVEGTLPIHSKGHSSWDNNPLVYQTGNNANVTVGVTAHVYNFKPSENVRITPAINIGGGHEWNTPGGNGFASAGPAIVVGYKNDDIVKVDFLNFKYNFGLPANQILWFGGYLSVHGTYKLLYGVMTDTVRQPLD
jgi:hypothetical protein